MQYEVTYTVKGILTCFVDVVEVNNIVECEAEVKKLVEQYTGQEKQIRIVLIKKVQGA